MSALLVLLASYFFQTPIPWPDHYIMANGIRIHYWRTNTTGKPVMILLHGSGDYGLSWANLAKNFADRYDIIMYDARGHGYTDPPPVSDSVDAMMEDLAELIRELKIQKPIIMGHSMGSITAAQFGARYPDVPRAVILADPASLGSDSFWDAAPPADGEPPLPAATSRARIASTVSQNNQTVEELTSRCLKSLPKWERSDCEFKAVGMRLQHPNTRLTQVGPYLPLRDLLPRIKARTLILKADAEGKRRTRNEEAAALLPNGKIVHIAGAGHYVHIDNRRRVIEVMREFLAGI